MKPNISVITAILRKDLIGLMPLVLLSCVIFLIAPAIANLKLESVLLEGEFWVLLQTNFYYISFFLAALLMISVLQQDPAASLHHDWLTRPIARHDWLLAKLLFMLVAIVLPVIAGRILINLGEGMGIGLSVSYALGVEKLGSLLFVPLLFIIALLTPNLRKFIGLFMAMVILFLFPAWSVTRLLLTAIGISLTSVPETLMWAQAVVMVSVSIVAIAGVYWFLYCRRQRGKAMACFWGLIVAVFLSFFPPTWLYDEDTALLIHRALINADNEELDELVLLDRAQACFPAAFIGAGYASEAEEAHLARAAWIGERLIDAGDNPLSFETTVSYREQLANWYSPSLYPREQSVKWRLDRVQTRAYYTADAIAENVPLRRSFTAVNRFQPIEATDSDYWLLPDQHIEALSADPTTALHVDYDLALLAPTPYELPVDGQRYAFAELGSCKADLDSLNNQIEVECLKRGNRASLISAQLIGVPASRQDNFNRASYTADWVQALGRYRTELTLSHVSIAQHSSIQLTAYNIERMLQKQLVFDGMLGDDSSVCPLPQAQSVLAAAGTNWSDKSSHQQSSIAVGNGVRIEVLDWRGGEIKNRPTLFLIHGLGASGHAWDDFAMSLSEYYNVVAMTRRGVAESSSPDQGYDIATLSADVLAVLDALELESPILVGHSLGGEELSYIGAHYPERVRGLIYADAAYDRTRSTDKRIRELSMSLPDAPPPRPQEMTSYSAMADYTTRIGRSGNIPEGELLATYDINTGRRTFNPLYLEATMMGLEPPRYSEITVPALGLFAVPGSAESLMEVWYDQNDPKVQATVQELFEREVQTKQEQIARFDNEIRDSRAIVLTDANHWIFLSHEDEVLAEIREFVDGLSASATTD